MDYKGIICGVDWLTATSQEGDAVSAWQRIFHNHRSNNPHDKTSVVRRHGFVGLHHAGMTWSIREYDQRSMIILAGEVAKEKWDKIVALPHKVTRIDLAADVMNLCHAEQVEDLYNNYNGTLKASLVVNKEGGATFYLGSRNSAQMGRVYDKGMKEDQKTYRPGQWLRFEVEFKSDLAQRVSDQVMECGDKFFIESKEAHVDRKYPRSGRRDIKGDIIAHIVRDWWVKRVGYTGFTWPKMGDVKLPRLAVRQTTAERKIAWLRIQVAPSIRFLKERGLMAEAMEALGIENIGKFDDLQDEVYDIIRGESP